ncbi:MAG TPA: S-layer homology domain-containing protein, partial [Blastocatellia bacterium]|nr:S-layer homology domain-containing protein [Blastocatellia bacterium]
MREDVTSEIGVTCSRIQFAVLFLSIAFLASTLGTVSAAPGNVSAASQTRIRSVSMGPSAGACGATITASARLEYKVSNPDNWAPLEGKVIGFSLGSVGGSGVTDSNGVATVSLTVPSDAASLSAVFNGDEAHNPVGTTIPFAFTGLCGLSPASQCFTYLGGAGSINVSAAADHNWTAASDSSWVVITLGSGGTGNGSVAFSVELNPTSARRTAVITVDDKSFAVKQAANFTDVPPDHIFFTEINILSANGITVGCGLGSYCPDEVVTRQQMAAFIIRAL